MGSVSDHCGLLSVNVDIWLGDCGVVRSGTNHVVWNFIGEGSEGVSHFVGIWVETSGSVKVLAGTGSCLVLTFLLKLLLPLEMGCDLFLKQFGIYDLYLLEISLDNTQPDWLRN